MSVVDKDRHIVWCTSRSNDKWESWIYSHLPQHCICYAIKLGYPVSDVSPRLKCLMCGFTVQVPARNGNKGVFSVYTEAG